MTIQVICPNCQKRYNLAPTLAGRRFRCNACQATITVPSDGMSKGQTLAVPAKPSATAVKPPAPQAKTPAVPRAEIRAAPQEPLPAPTKSKAGTFALLGYRALAVLFLCVAVPGAGLVVYFATHKSTPNGSAKDTIADAGDDDQRPGRRPAKPVAPLGDDAALDQLASLLSDDHWVGRREHRRCVEVLKDEHSYNEAMNGSLPEPENLVPEDKKWVAAARKGMLEQAENFMEWPDDKEWVEAVRKLGESRFAPVAATVAGAKEPLDIRSNLVTLKIKTDAEAAAAHQKLEQAGVGLFGPNQWLSDGEVEQAFRDGQITAGQASDYRMLRDERAPKQFEAWYNGQVVGEKVWRFKELAPQVHRKAVPLESDVFKKHLLPALKARAGRKIEHGPLDLYYGVLDSRFNEALATWVNSPAVFFSVHSHSNQELTRLTLVIDMPSRCACVYIPKLKPNEPIRLAPILIEGTGFVQGAKPPRYSIYCDQFSVEDQPGRSSLFEDQPGKSSLFEYGYCALLLDSEFACPSFVGPIPSLDIGDQMFRLVINDRQRTDKGYTCTVELNQYDEKDKAKITASSIYKGTVLPLPPGQQFETTLLQFELTGAGETMRMVLSLDYRNDNLVWGGWQGGALQGRGMISEEAQAYINEKMKAIDQANSLASEGRKDEARKILNDFIATRPGPKLENDASKALKDIELAWSLQGVLGSAYNLEREGKPGEARKLLNQYLATRPDRISEDQARKALETADATAQQEVQSVIISARVCQLPENR